MIPQPIRPSRWGKVLLGGLLAAVSASVILRFVGETVPTLVFAGLGTLLLGCLGLGVVWQGSGIFARPILGVRTSRAELALTFDDGPDPDVTPRLLDLLDARGHRATFFVIGVRAARHPQLLQEIVRRGHGLGHHSWSHSPITNLLAPTRLAAGLRDTAALLSAAGAGSRWFRPPVGLLSPRIAAASRLAGVELVAWTANARDGVAGQSTSRAFARLIPFLRPGAILVLHDGAIDDHQPIAPRLLPDLLDRLDSLGLRSVTIDELFRSS